MPGRDVRPPGRDVAGAALVVLAAAGFGTLGPLARFAGEAGLSAISFALARAVVSAVFLGAVLAVVVAGRWVTWTRWSALTRLEKAQLAAMGVFVAGTTVSVLSAFERTTIAVALICFYTYPLIVAASAVRLYGERLTIARVGAIALASLGMVLVVITPSLGSTELVVDVVGVAFGLAAASFQAGYALTAARGYVSVPALQAAALIRSFAVPVYLLVLVPIVVMGGQGAGLQDVTTDPEAWLTVLLAGTVAAALPTILLLEGYRRVGPTRGAVLMLFEPLVGVALAALILTERPEPLQILGGLLVFLGAALVQVRPPTTMTVVGEPLAE